MAHPVSWWSARTTSTRGDLGIAVRSRLGVQPVRRSNAGRRPVPDPRPSQLPVAERGRRTFGDDPAGRDHRDPVSEELSLIHVVGGEQHRHAERRQVLDHVPRLAAGRGVKAGGRLVEEQQFRVADQGNRDVQPPLLAAGQLAHPGAPLVLQADQADHLVHRPRMRVEGGIHGDRLAHGEVPVDARGLQHEPGAALQPGPLTARIHAKNAHLAAVTGPVALQDLDRGRLARPVRPEQREHLALTDRQVDAADRGHALV